MFKFNRVISLALMYGLFLFGFAWFLFNGLDLIIWSTLALFALGLVIYVLIDKLELNENYKIFVGLAVWLNALAYAYFYQRYLYAGYPIHFVDSILITFIVYDYFKKNLKVEGVQLFICTFLTLIGIVSMWEIYEYLTGIILHIKIQGIFVLGNALVRPIDDTMWDIIIGGLGSLLTLISREIVPGFNRKSQS